MAESHIALPAMYSECLTEGYYFTELTPEDSLPKDYYTGPDEPDIKEKDLPTDGTQAYWFDTRKNEVKVARKVYGGKIDWMGCDMIRLIADLNKTPIVAIGKIVRDPNYVSPIDTKPKGTSFKEALDLVRRRKKKEIA